MRGLGLWLVVLASATSAFAVGESFDSGVASFDFGVASFDFVKARYAESEGVLLDRNGQILHESRLDNRARRLAWVELKEVSPTLVRAVVESEDHDFWTHAGVDWWALAGATARAAARGAARWVGSEDRTHTRGASTISMQLAAMLEPKRLGRAGRRGVAQKWDQIGVARELERRWSKDQILEAYLNEVSFRGELEGIGAAAHGVFGKAPHGLSWGESLVLAALIRQPGADPERVRARSCELGRRLRPGLDCALELSGALETGLAPRPLVREVALAPHLAARVWSAPHLATRVSSDPRLKARVGSSPPASSTRVQRVSLDRELQAYVLERLRAQLLSVRDRNVRDGAVVVLDNRSGEALAYVGGAGEGVTSAPYVDGVRAPRQAGSTLKPFLYAQAIEGRYLTADSPLADTPADIPVAGGVYHPRNFDNEFHGEDVSLRQALGSSLNVPAVRVLGQIGVEAGVSVLRRLGFEGLKEASYYGPSLALGAVDITLWDLANAYRVLANGGEYTQARWSVSGGAGSTRRIYSPQTAYVISDILSDRESRTLTFGLENPLGQGFWAAAKTGTSKDMRDNWCVGYSERYTVAVWVGNFDGQPMWNVTGITGAGPVWSEVMQWLHNRALRRVPSRAPARPATGLVRAPTRGGGLEWYLVGTEPADLPGVGVTGVKAPPKITYPAEGMAIALDPDIPADAERVVFTASGARAGLRWVLDGSVLTSRVWAPRGAAGHHRLEIQSGSGAMLDAVEFDVRGMGRLVEARR